jgi:hypothetical protein
LISEGYSSNSTIDIGGYELLTTANCWANKENYTCEGNLIKFGDQKEDY